MGDHAQPTEPSLIQSEPVTVSELTRDVVAVLVAGGWLTINSATLNWLTSALGVVISVVLTIWSRRHVTPLAAPRDTEGRPLTVQ